MTGMLSDSPGCQVPKLEGGEPSDVAVISSGRLDHSLASSLAWRAVADWSSQILSWTAFLIVVRLLSPADFGIVSMSVVLLGYLRFVGEFGVPATIVALRDLTDDQIAQLNTVAVLVGLGCFGLACLVAHPIALFFKTPRVGPVVIVSCFTLVTLAFRAVPEGLLDKEMRIGLLSFLSACRDIIIPATTLALAFLGFGYWALVWGNVIGFAARTVMLLGVRPYRFAVPRLRSISKPLLFGWRVAISSVAWSAYNALDNVTAGRMLGDVALGFYGMAWNLANVPLEKVTSLVTTVVPTYLAAVQTDLSALRRYVRGLTEVMALATFPPTIGLGLVASELIPFALGRKWDPAIPALEVLSAYAAFRSVVALLSKLLTAIGHARYVMWVDVAAVAIMPTAFYLGSYWGIAGIAWGWVAAYPLVALPLYWKTFRTIEMGLGEYFRALRPALDGSVVMVLVVLGLKWALPASWHILVKLILEVTAGGVAYIGAALILHRQRALALYNMVASARRARP